MPVCPIRSSVWPRSPNIWTKVPAERLEVGPTPFWPTLTCRRTRICRWLTRDGKLSCGDSDAAHDLDQCTRVILIGAVVDPAVDGLEHSRPATDHDGHLVLVAKDSLGCWNSSARPTHVDNLTVSSIRPSSVLIWRPHRPLSGRRAPRVRPSRPSADSACPPTATIWPF